MAIKANASSQGSNIKSFVGVGSFRVLGVNPNKAELEKFFGRAVDKEPEYLKEKEDANDGNKKYRTLRVSFMIQADKEYEDGKVIEANKNLKEPLKKTINFFLDSRYFYNKDKTKVQVIDNFGRTAWVTIEQAKNHQIPVYKNGPARLDADYRPAHIGEAELTEFVLNYLNVTPIDTYNSNTGEWTTNPHPEDCEGRLEKIKDYFAGDISELKEFCTYLPTNRIKLLLGVEPDDQGRLNNNVYTRLTMRNGSKSYTRFKDAIDGDKAYLESQGKEFNAIYSNDPIGVIEDLKEYDDSAKETDLTKTPVESEDPFAQAAAIPESGSDLGDADPFAQD